MKKLLFQKENKERLDKFLVGAIHELPLPTNFSRSQIQKIIKEGKVLVNNGSVPVHYFLKKDDLIEIKEITKSKKKKTVVKIPVVYEDENYFVINKPEGLAVEGSPNEYCLIDWLKERRLTKTKDEEFNQRRGLIHRLDKDVSGVMLIAKTPEFFYKLKEQFKKHLVKKVYLALVYGIIEQAEGQLNFLMARGKDGKMAARPQNQEGKTAITEFKVIKRFKNYTFVQIKILTGRTHQIRVHFFAFNHPVVGDRLYHQKRIKPPAGLKRLFLHSQQIGFYDLNNQWQEYKIELPKELKEVLKKLR